MKRAALVLGPNFASMPNDFVSHIRQWEFYPEICFRLLLTACRSLTAGVVLRTTYGYDVAATNDEYVHLAEAAGGSLLQVVHTGSYLVDYLPALKYIPCECEISQLSVALMVSPAAWFPGLSLNAKPKNG